MKCFRTCVFDSNLITTYTIMSFDFEFSRMFAKKQKDKKKNNYNNKKQNFI